MPTSLVVYVLAVLGCDLALAGWELEFTVLLPRTDAAGAHGIGVHVYAQAAAGPKAGEMEDEATDACP